MSFHAARSGAYMVRDAAARLLTMRVGGSVAGTAESMMSENGETT